MSSDFQDAYNAGLSQQQPRPTLPSAISDRAVVLIDGEGNERIEYIPLEAITGKAEEKRGTIAFLDVDSFARYVTSQKEAGTRVFVNRTKQTVEAVIDGHTTAAGWGRHRAKLVTTQTRVWQEWINFAAKAHEQLAFAHFIETHITEIANPDGATLLDMVSTLEVKTNVEFAQATKLSNGQVKLTYNETVQGTAMRGEAEIPENLTLVMQPIEGHATNYVIPAKLRYRVGGGKLTLQTELHRPLDILEQAFDDRTKDLASKVGAEVIFQGDAPAELTPTLRK